MRVRFWGTRGSLAKPGPATLRYGGNTPCLEVRTDDGTLIVLDCGTGAHDLGRALAAEGPAQGHLMITHTHWDHIQGFPFFAPLFLPEHEWNVYAPYGLGSPLQDTLAGQMGYAYFPVTLDQLSADIKYNDLVEGEFYIGKVHVTTRYLNHPVPTLGYRFSIGGAVLVYATDHEPHSQHVHELTHLPVHHEDLRHIEFLSDADLVIHDTQYTAEEYPGKVGWGHTSMENGVEFAIAANARKLALFHHDPWRDDDALDQLVEIHQRSAAGRGSQLEVFAAAEGEVLELPEQKDATTAAAEELPSSISAVFEPAETTVLVVDNDPTIVRLLVFALRPEGCRVVIANDGETALQMALEERPDLVLMEWDMSGLNGLEVCRALRAEQDPKFQEMPIVLMTTYAKAGDIAGAFDSGVTDYITKPFTPQFVRTRVHAWLLRARKGIARDLYF